MFPTVVAFCHPGDNTFGAVGALTLVAVELVLPLLVVPAVPEVVTRLVYLHSVMILHDACKRLLL